MKHLGDFDTSAVIYGKFTTFRPSTGAAFTLGGTPALSVYKDNSTTQSTTGVTLTADFDAVTGLNHFAIDTSTDGTFYSAGSFFDIVITTGTVDSVSVVGAVVGGFTIRKNSALKPATAGRTVVVDAAGLVDANTVKVGPTGSGTAQTARDIGASVLLSSGTGTGQISLSSGLVTLAGVTHTGAVIPTVTTVTNQLTAAAIATGVWRDSTAGDFTVASSIGKALYISNIAPGASGGHMISGSNSGTTTFGALTVTGATTFTGAISGTNASNDLRVNTVALSGTSQTARDIGASVLLSSGTGTGQLSLSSGLVTLAGVTHTGAVIPTVTTVTNQLTVAQIATGVWQDSTAGDFTTASSIGKSLYNAFTSNTSVFTTASLVNAPTGGSAPTVSQIATAVWQDTTAGDFTVAGSIGKSLFTSGAVPGASGGLFIAGSNAATSVNITGNITGNLSGSVGSVTGNVDGNVVGTVASVVGAVGSVTGAVGSVTATVSADVVSISGDSTAADNLESYLDGTSFMPVDAHKPIFSISGATLTVKKPDGSTTAYTRTLATDAAAEPVIGSS